VLSWSKAVSDHYCNLLRTATVPEQVCQGLKAIVYSASPEREQSSKQSQTLLQTEFQLGLCYASGFGVETNHAAAIDHIMNAARGGLREAMAVAPIMHAAFGISISSSSSSEICSLLEKAWRGGSITAMQDLGHFRDGHGSTYSPDMIALWPHEEHVQKPLDLQSFHASVLADNLHGYLRHKA
jgi:hypothetical protein